MSSWTPEEWAEHLRRSHAQLTEMLLWEALLSGECTCDIEEPDGSVRRYFLHGSLRRFRRELPLLGR